MPDKNNEYNKIVLSYHNLPFRLVTPYGGRNKEDIGRLPTMVTLLIHVNAALHGVLSISQLRTD